MLSGNLGGVRARAEITDRALASISTFAPHLTHLTLLQCGRLDDDVLTAWSHPLTGFKDLRHLTLYAPYLVRAEKWKEFFEGIGGADEKGEGEGEGVVTKKRPELETFQLRMSSRAFVPLAPSPSLPSVETADDCVYLTRRTRPRAQVSTTRRSRRLSNTTLTSSTCNSPNSANSPRRPSRSCTPSRAPRRR